MGTHKFLQETLGVRTQTRMYAFIASTYARIDVFICVYVCVCVCVYALCMHDATMCVITIVDST